MKLLKKVVVVLMLKVIIITMFGVGINKSNATDVYVVGEVGLYSKSMLVCMSYEGSNYPIDFVVYKEGDFEYPAYPLWKKARCVVDANKTKTEIDGIFKNAVVRSAILNGYPFKQPEELGCESEIEAYGATSIAINNILNGCDLGKFNPFDTKGERILNATKKILKKTVDPNGVIPKGI